MEKRNDNEKIAKFMLSGRRSLKMLGVIGIFIMLIWTMLLYQVEERSVRNSLEREVQKNEQYLLNYNELLENICKEVYNDPVIAKVLMYKEYTAGDFMLARNRIDSYRVNSSVVQSIYVYEKNMGRFYVSADSSYNKNGVQSLEDFQDEDFLKALKTRQVGVGVPCIRQIRTTNDRNKEETDIPVCTYLFSNIIGKNYLDENMVVVNANQDVLFSNLQYDDAGGQMAVVADQSGKLLYASDLEEIEEDSLEELISGWDSGKMNWEKSIRMQGASYSVQGVYIESMQWWLICFMPRNFAFWRLGPVILILTLFIILVLVMGFLMMGKNEKRRQIPVLAMADEIETLQAEKEKDNEKLTSKVLFDILMGWKEYRLKDLQSSFSEYHIDLDAEADYYLLVVKMDRYSEYCIKYLKKGQALMMHVIMEVFEQEMLKLFAKTKGLEMSYDTLVVICQEGSEITSYDLIETQIKEAKHRLEAYDVTVSVMTSEPFESLRNISYIYEKTKESMNVARLFQGYDMTESMQRLDIEPYVPGRKLSNRLIDCLMRGDFEGARTEYGIYIRKLEHFEGTYVQRELSNFSMLVANAADTIMKNNHVIHPYVYKEIVLYNSDVETIEELTNRFYTLLDQIEGELSKKKNSKHADLVAQMICIVEENYMDENLSIQEVADRLKISYSQARNIFKAHMQISLSDYILQYRLERVKEMLLMTTDSVKAIEEKCGFSNYAYFYRVFKKFVGSTPIDYRMYHKEEKKSMEDSEGEQQ